MPKSAQTRSGSREPDSFGNQDQITLDVLTAIERDSNTSQRMLSSELGVALGLANAYLKRCVRKGWIKIQQVPPRRYAYYLTPQGFSEKARLTGSYLSASFTFFRRAREQMSALMQQCIGNGGRRIGLAGVSELAEVGVLCAQDHDILLAGIVDPDHAGEVFLGLSVVASPDALGDVDAIILTDLLNPAKVLQSLRAGSGVADVLVPEMLKLNVVSGVSVGIAEEVAE